MDETKARWFRWLADHISYVFWTIWGTGAGTALAIFCGAASAGGEVLRIYLAILTAMMGGVLGLATSRAMDTLNDQRERRRKIFSILVLARDLRWELNNLNEAIVGIKASGRKIDHAGSALTNEEVNQLLVRSDRVCRACAEVPSFDNLVESEDDVAIAVLCRSQFIFCVNFFDVKADIDASSPNQKVRAALLVLGDAAEARVTALDRADRYLSKRVATPK